MITGLTIKEAAKKIGRSPKTLYRWIYEGRIKKTIRVGGRVYIPQAELKKLRKEERHS